MKYKFVDYHNSYENPAMAIQDIKSVCVFIIAVPVAAVLLLKYIKFSPCSVTDRLRTPTAPTSAWA